MPNYKKRRARGQKHDQLRPKRASSDLTAGGADSRIMVRSWRSCMEVLINISYIDQLYVRHESQGVTGLT